MKNRLQVARRVLAISILVAPHLISAQQRADTAFRPVVTPPAYAASSGPRLCLDEAHYNFHTLDGRFHSFGALATRDGYRVRPSRAAFTAAVLAECDLLVISNAQPNDEPWTTYPQPTPSAFTDAEIAAVLRWVQGGGSLLLIADHMPLAGAAKRLAAAFGAAFTDGFAYAPWGTDSPRDARALAERNPAVFVRENGSLRGHAITDGAGQHRITQVRTFTGQAFRWDRPGVAPLLVLPPDFVSLEPRIAWQFEDDTPIRQVGGWLQGAVRQEGRGRVAMFGEAAMFSAQRAGPGEGRPMGMNAPMAEQNAQFALNLLAWLVDRTP
ncbi:MAG: hypothetical protein KF709_02870 [Gemmatimonadaceae bacterium]|nr:hypothetical protein [Gemmatimonadaceae bacterium]